MPRYWSPFVLLFPGKNIRENPIQENDNQKKYMKNILEMTANKMNHTPAVCKKEYLMPQWFTIQPQELHKMTNRKNFRDFITVIAKN